MEDTICVVTGAGNGGIGYGQAEIAATYTYLACLDLHQSVCDIAVRKLLKTCPIGTNAVGIECDVTKPSSIKHAADKILEAFPNKRIGVFANAGIIESKAKIWLWIQIWMILKQLLMSMCSVLKLQSKFLSYCNKAIKVVLCATPLPLVV